MTSFIYTPKGYINLARVQMAQFTGTGKNKIIVDNEVVDENHHDFGSTIISVIPTQGEWESINILHEDDGSKSWISEPVIAWGLTALGHLTPITPSEMHGIEGTYALRKTGDTRIYTSSATYDSLDGWLEDILKPEKPFIITGT